MVSDRPEGAVRRFTEQFASGGPASGLSSNEEGKKSKQGSKDQRVHLRDSELVKQTRRFFLTPQIR